MRKWIPVALIVLAILWFALTNLGSALALTELGTRPILALTRGDERILTQTPIRAAAPGEAALVGGQGIHFGYSSVYRLPDDSLVTCRYRFRSVSCDDGWQPERP
ncbi:hypothetical protein [Tabrizicola aquatica]|uniref:hypothetical protein n=1 Tax=Tabrizicola aquatica TaxID=909926 RepID=UPI000CD30F38|nr:hypothetical protein [Tabrizicola aquatica]